MSTPWIFSWSIRIWPPLRRRSASVMKSPSDRRAALGPRPDDLERLADGERRQVFAAPGDDLQPDGQPLLRHSRRHRERGALADEVEDGGDVEAVEAALVVDPVIFRVLAAHLRRGVRHGRAEQG